MNHSNNKDREQNLIEHTVLKTILITLTLIILGYTLSTTFVSAEPNMPPDCPTSSGYSCTPGGCGPGSTDTGYYCPDHHDPDGGGSISFVCCYTPYSGPTHLACDNLACTQVPGEGANTCSTDNDCSHSECQSNSCVRVIGSGVQQCTVTDDCKKLNKSYYYTRDLNANIISIKDPRNMTSTNTYNSMGKLVSSQHPDTGWINFTYDTEGNMLSRHDSLGVTNYTYDIMGRMIRMSSSTNQGVMYEVNYTYDSCQYGKGKICKVTDSSGSTEYSFDQRGRITRKQIAIRDKRYALNYSYNSADDVTTLFDPVNQKIEYKYNALNRVTQILQNGRPVLNLSYGKHGKPTEYNYFVATQSIFESITYTPTLLVNSIYISAAQPYATSNAFLAKTLHYNEVENVRSYADNINMQQPGSYAGLTDSAQFSYDTNYQLITEQYNRPGAQKTITHTYDLIGNQLTKQDSTNPNAQVFSYYPNTNRLQQVAQASMPTISLSYDTNGNLANQSDGKQYLYDHAHNLIQFKQNSNWINYTYNFEGDLVYVETPNQKIYYVYSNGAPIFKDTYNLVKKYVPKPYDQVKIAESGFD
jgi:YD repeat-containing protein